MSESRRKYVRKQFLYTPEQAEFIARKAVERDPDMKSDKRGERFQTVIARDMADFAMAQEKSFDAFVASRGAV